MGHGLGFRDSFRQRLAQTYIRIEAVSQPFLARDLHARVRALGGHVQAHGLVWPRVLHRVPVDAPSATPLLDAVQGSSFRGVGFGLTETNSTC